jgi:uncharacterized protein (TIGR00251 family)
MEIRRPTTIAVTVKPSAKSTVVSIDHGQVHVRVKEPASEGRANEACRKALAKALGVAPSTLKLVRGAQSRVKIFALSLTSSDLAVRLARLPP